MATVPAARQTLDVLTLLSRQAGPTPAATIVRELGLPRSTVYHLLDTLTAAGYVTHLVEERRYALGLAAYELGSGYARQAPLAQLSRVPLAELADRTGHAAHLAVLHGRDVAYLVEERAPGQPPLVTDVGVRLPAALTASGRAILARLPAAQLRALFPDPSAFVVRTNRGPRSLSALRAELAEARRRGHAHECDEVSDGWSSVGDVVVDHSGHPVAGLAVTFPTADATAGHQAEVARQVATVAARLTRRISGSPG